MISVLKAILTYFELDATASRVSSSDHSSESCSESDSSRSENIHDLRDSERELDI